MSGPCHLSHILCKFDCKMSCKLWNTFGSKYEFKLWNLGSLSWSEVQSRSLLLWKLGSLGYLLAKEYCIQRTNVLSKVKWTPECIRPSLKLLKLHLKFVIFQGWLITHIVKREALFFGYRVLVLLEEIVAPLKLLHILVCLSDHPHSVNDATLEWHLYDSINQI